jgi:peptidase M23-like protein
MARHRTTARGLLVLLLLSLVGGGLARGATRAVPRIMFPVVGPAQYIDDFGAPRAGGSHQGVDIMAPKKALAVATEAGRIKFWTTSASAGCMLYLYGKSGTMYEYIHLNNDVGKGNDNRGKCVAGMSYAPGLKNGSRVSAGQTIGFVGDSGDANGIHAHLHFEVHPGGNAATDPYPYLKAAQHLLFSVPPGSVYTLSLAGSVVSTADGELTLKVAGLHEWTTGLNAKNVGRTLVLSVPDTAAIQAAPHNGVVGRKLALSAATKGTKAVVWSLPAVATLKAERGDRDAIAAALVLLYTP